MLRLALMLITLLAPTFAFAHAVLMRSDPPVGGSVATSPPALTITFSERVEPQFTTVKVLDPGNNPVAIGELRPTGADGKTVAASLPKLAPGKYSVVYNATSVDTHKTKGRYTFTVGR
ncbi:MAG TPA: copper resistance protein CopC [Acetobacteraceae bacterium]|nr:copper resistance protein CopC [Acetobacteraceae bacterium]